MDLNCVTSCYNRLCIGNSVEKEKTESARRYFLKERQKIEDNIALLADERSRNVYRKIIEFRCTGRNSAVKTVSEKAKLKYLDDLVDFAPNEKFVDVGAFLGETTFSVYKKIRKLFPEEEIDFSALVIEPDPFNNGVCNKNLSRCKFRFLTEKCAVGSECGTARFHGDIFGSCRMNEDGEKSVELSTLDILCKKHGFTPSYVKFDIEGAELEALKGAQEIINTFRPRLAVSIYHSDRDMVEIIREIKSRHPFYSFYIRHYSGFFAETVLYCIPK